MNKMLSSDYKTMTLVKRGLTTIAPVWFTNRPTFRTNELKEKPDDQRCWPRSSGCYPDSDQSIRDLVSRENKPKVRRALIFR
jgi:hypothetical protein